MLPIGSFFALIVMPSATAGDLADDVAHVPVAHAGLTLADEPRVLGEPAGVEEERERRGGRTPRGPRAGWPVETGCPPPELFVIVIITTGTSAARSASSASRATTSMSPLNGCRTAGSRPSGITRSTASAPLASTFARVVSKCVLFGTTLPGTPDRAEEDPLGGPSLVGGDHVLEREQLLDRVAEHEPRGRARVRLVTVLDGCPLVARHRAGPAVGEQVDEDVVGTQAEQVVARVDERSPALVLGGEPQRLDRVDPERLDDRARLEGARCHGLTLWRARSISHGVLVPSSGSVAAEPSQLLVRDRRVELREDGVGAVQRTSRRPAAASPIDARDS